MSPEYYRSDRRRAQKRFWATSLRSRYGGLKSSAKRRELIIDLSFEDYSHIVEVGQCHYCGGELPKTGHGLDRLNSSVGYYKSNCVPCCSHCNNKKSRIEGLGFSWFRAIELMLESSDR